MTNAELINALQCASHFALYQDCYEKNCYANSGKGLYCNIPKLIADAADALEAAEKRIAELEADKKTLINVVKDKSDFHATKDAMRIADLEARLLKIKSRIYDLENIAKREYDDDHDNEYLEGYFDGMHQAAKIISTTPTIEER